MYLNINPTLKKYCEISGYSERAVREKISQGVWMEGKQYLKAPDKHIIILLEGVDEWHREQA